MRHTRRTVTTLFGFLLAAGLVALPVRDRIDRDGYTRNPSLWALFFPQMEGAYRASLVKSIQRGTITVSAATSNTATITSVSTANTRLKLLGNTADQNDQDMTRAFCRLALTNATTVTASKGSATGANIVSWEAVEYWPGVLKSIQRGTIVFTNGGTNTPTATITAVTTSKAEIDDLGVEQGNNGTNTNIFANLVLTNTTTVTATRNAPSSTPTRGFQVVEWK